MPSVRRRYSLNVAIRLIVLAVSMGWWIDAPQSPPSPLTPIELAVKATYRRMFGELIERPAIHNTGAQCQEQRAGLMTTAYLRQSSTTSRLLSMYTTFDGTDTSRIGNSIVMTPAGTIRVLVAFIQYAETVDDDALAHWERSQALINEDHATFAKARGYAAPIVVFRNTNAVIRSPAEGLRLRNGTELNPRVPDSMRGLLQERGFAPDDFELVVAVDMHPVRFAGGISINQRRFIHVGNYFRRTSPLSARDWMYVGRTVYHHEVAHQWGWPGTHDWDAHCEPNPSEPFIVPPVLFGWEDTDGDRIPEILDGTPYGRPGA